MRSAKARVRSCAFVALLSNILLTSCDKPGDVEQVARYVNEAGEEVYGPEYRPGPPMVRSVPLLVGTPNAGVRVPDDLKGALQETLLPEDREPVAPEGISAPAEAPRIPLRRAHMGAGGRFRSPAETAGVDDFRPGAPADDETVAAESIAEMTAHFVFVGQGDAAILEFPCGVAVIDSGGEFGNQGQVDGGQLFIDYLRSFFEDRPHLDDTIDVLFTTHPHADHLNGLPLLVDQDTGELLFTVANVVDNGQTAQTGSLGKQTRFRNAVVDSGGAYSAVELSRQVSATGATNGVIDPFECEDIDPIITAFWGGLNEELPEEDLESTAPYSNPNNHSVVVRVDFGESSFLFTGDLEDRGERDLRQEFQDNPGVFDVDVYQVSHHGADDDTSDEFLEIMSPRIAVISMGEPDAQVSHTAWDHGHPRTGLLSVLQDHPAIVVDEREEPAEFLAAAEQEGEFGPILISRAIYGTGWEGTIRMVADSQGNYDVLLD